MKGEKEMEHPDITRMNRFGTLEIGDEEEKQPVCPVCGEECESFYKSKSEIVGCEMCVKRVDV